jgi:hypothetical protein
LSVEVPLASYQHLQQPRAVDEGLFRRILGGLACREYAACAEAVPTAFGLSASSVSRRFVRASARRLQELQERSLADERWVALFLDGKTFADDELVIALGVTLQGEKRVLGLVQTATENQRVCAALLRELVERGFAARDGLLVVLDGAKGLRAADAFNDVGLTELGGRLMYATNAGEAGVHVGTLFPGDIPVSGTYFYLPASRPTSLTQQVDALRGALVGSTISGDLRAVHAVGPIRLGRRQTADVWLAVVAGEDKAELLADAAAAEADIAARMQSPPAG